MAKQRARVDHPLLERLQKLDREVARQFPDATFPGLWTIGLRLDRKLDKSRWSHYTPTNCRTFASTGLDGVHFSFLVQDGMVRATSPIVLTVPGAAANLVVGQDLFDFLCLGARRGYVALQELAYSNSEAALEAFTNPAWQPTESWHESVGFVPDEAGRQVLALLTSEFGLHSWPSADRFAVLQEQWAGSLEVPEWKSLL
jgi:hypothetical protein